MADTYANLNSDEKIQQLAILNIYELNLYQILNIMFWVKTNSIPETLQNKFKVIEHNYSTIYSEYNFKKVNTISKSQNFLLGLLNLQYCHMDYVSGISILTNFWKQQTRHHFLKPKSKITSQN